jgi:uncharacterized sporulation protein YeaH/YhbH (DUF444 family)
MTRRIDEDYGDYRKVIRGTARKNLRNYIDRGYIFGERPGRDGKIGLPIDRIHIPHLVHGESKKGIGRGQGKEGDVIAQDPQKGKNGNKAGDEHSEGIEIQVDVEYILKMLQKELALPNLKPKENNFDEVKIKYNNISLLGPNSLRHMRKTYLQALKRLTISGEGDKLYKIPGYAHPVRMIVPIRNDFRYRQYREIKIPASNAVIFFARDCSISMDDAKCDIVSDMSWWIDAWIRRFYKRTEHVYFVHDTQAEEVDQEKFYKYRYGGGTRCSSALKLIAKQLKNRFPPHKWNVYIFYFSDGENFYDDNEIFFNTIQDSFPPNIVNFMGLTQILAWNYQGSLKQHIDEKIKEGKLNSSHIRTTSIGKEKVATSNQILGMYPNASAGGLSLEERSIQIKNAIKDLLGKQETKIKMPYAH